MTNRSRGSRGLSKWQQAGAQPRPLRGAHAPDVTEHMADGSWVVRRISGSTSTKSYTCPGCHQQIRPATPHVVAWSADPPLLGGEVADDRRHWHSPCWDRKARAGR